MHELLPLLRRAPSLHVTLQGKGITDIGLRELSNAPTLQGLRLIKTNTTSEALSSLAGTNIETVAFLDIPVDGRTVEHLKACLSLTTLHFCDISLDETFIESLSGLPSLRCVGISVEEAFVTGASEPFKSLAAIHKHLPNVCITTD